MRRSDFLDAARLLFPRGRTFDLTEERNMTRLVDGLLLAADSERERAEKVYSDYFPQTTRALREFQDAFRFRFSDAFSEDEIRRALSALVRMRYANSTPEGIGDVMREFVPECRIVENVPVANAAGLCFAYRATCGNRNVVCGNRRAVCNWHIGDRSWVPTLLRADRAGGWNLPYLPGWWQMCFFVCKEEFRDGNGNFIAVKRLRVHEKWKDFLEFVILRLKPVRSIAIMFVEYVPDGEEIAYVDDAGMAGICLKKIGGNK